jgi:hypothetical protein
MPITQALNARVHLIGSQRSLRGIKRMPQIIAVIASIVATYES